MTEEQKKSLETKLWSIANTLRGKMNADEFLGYALGFIFCKYPSERLHIYPNDILNEDGIEYLSLDEATSEEHIITTNWRGGFMEAEKHHSKDWLRLTESDTLEQMKPR